ALAAPVPFADLFTREKLIALEFDGADPVLLPFRDNKPDDHMARIRVLELNVLNLEIDIAIIAVKLRQLLLVIIKLLILQNTRTSDPGKHPTLPGFDHLSQLLLAKSLGADKIDPADSDLGGLRDLVGDRAAPGLGIDIGAVFNLGFLIAGLL